MLACRSVRRLGAYGLALSLVVLVAVAVAGLGPPGPDGQPARPAYQAVSVGEILPGRAGPRSAETPADQMLVAASVPSLVALRCALIRTGHVIRPLPWPPGDRGPPR